MLIEEYQKISPYHARVSILLSRIKFYFTMILYKNVYACACHSTAIYMYIFQSLINLSNAEFILPKKINLEIERCENI